MRDQGYNIKKIDVKKSVDSNVGPFIMKPPPIPLHEILPKLVYTKVVLVYFC